MNEFDHRPDEFLGRALREALSSPDDMAFVRRVMAAIPANLGSESWWEVLGDWARPGLDAALVALAAGGAWLADRGAPEPPAPQTEELVAVASETLSARTLLTSRTLPEFNAELVLDGSVEQ